jgi:probable phosphoglycerate mutase
MEAATTVLHLVRHGESEWNLAGLLQGQTGHVPLTPAGRCQAQDAARLLAGRDVAAVLSSDLLRARQTATVVAAAVRRPVVLDPRLREQSYGELEGRASADVLAQAPYDFTDADARARGGESLRDVHARMSACLADCVDRYRGQEVVLVSHGDAIRVGLAALAGLGPHEVPWREVGPGSVTTVPASSDGRVRAP